MQSRTPDSNNLTLGSFSYNSQVQTFFASQDRGRLYEPKASPEVLARSNEELKELELVESHSNSDGHIFTASQDRGRLFERSASPRVLAQSNEELKQLKERINSERVASEKAFLEKFGGII